MTTAVAAEEKAEKRELTGEAAMVASRSERRTRMTFMGLGVVLAALVGFGFGWMVFRDSGGVDLPSDVDQLLVDYRDAWINGDGDAAVALMTAGGVHVSPTTPPGGVSGDALAAAIDSGPLALTDAETLAVWGDPPYLVIQTDQVAGLTGYSVFEIAEELGELKIASQTVYFE